MSNLTSLNNKPNPNFVPPSNVISLDNRRQYIYTDNSTKATFSPENGIIGTYTGYPFQVVNIQPNDVILLKIADNLSLRECQTIQKEMNETFPNNTVVLCNDHILKGITVLRGETEKVSDIVDITTTIDVDKMFEELMKGNSNDFLY